MVVFVDGPSNELKPSDRAITHGFAFPSLDGRIMVWHEDLREPIAVARRGSHHNFVSGLAFHDGKLYDATLDGSVHETTTGKLVYVAPEHHAIHHLEGIDGALVAMLSIPSRLSTGYRDDPPRDITFVHLPDGEKIVSGTIHGFSESRKDELLPTIAAQRVKEGWDILAFTGYRVRGEEVTCDNLGYDSCYSFVRNDDANRIMSLNGGPGSSVILVPFSHEDTRPLKEIKLSDVMYHLTLAVKASGRYYFAGYGDNPAASVLYALDDLAQTEARRVEVTHFVPRGKNNAAVVLSRDYIDDTAKVQMRSLDIQGYERVADATFDRASCVVVVREGQDFEFIVSGLYQKFDGDVSRKRIRETFYGMNDAKFDELPVGKQLKYRHSYSRDSCGGGKGMSFHI